MDRLSRLSISIRRQLMARLLSKPLGLLIVNEYPKSGASWIGEMISALSGLPFPRNRMPSFERSVMHGHYYSSFGLKNVLTVWRDGRDVMVSFYFHCYFFNDKGNSRLVRLMREKLPFPDYDNVSANLPRFIDVMLSRPPWPSFTWAEFVDRWWNRAGTTNVKYESMLENPGGELVRIFSEIGIPPATEARISEIVDCYSFSRMKAAMPDGKNGPGFLRKGIAGDWKNYFNSESASIFDHYAGDALINMGYESDRTWLEEVPDSLPGTG